MCSRLRSVVAVVVMVCCTVGADTIVSVSSGGVWEDTLTWVGHRIPGSGDDVVINGTVSATASSATCRDMTISQDAVLQNGGGLGWVTVSITGSLTNSGTIRNNPTSNELWLNVAGDLVNNGTWTPAKTHILSTRSQDISQTSGTEFRGIFLKKSAGGTSDTFPLVAGSDLFINASQFDCNGYSNGSYYWGKVDMAGHNLTLMGGTSFFGAALHGTDTVICRDSSIISSSTFEEAVTLAGRTTITDSRVTFNGEVTVADTLQNGGSLGWVTLYVRGGIVNTGMIRNHPGGNELWMEIGRNVTNRGVWANKKNTMTDSVDQVIGLDSSRVIQAPFIFDALWTSGPYEWRKDTQAVTDGSGRLLHFDSLTMAVAGVYRCKHDSVWSRTITVREGSAALIRRPGGVVAGAPMSFTSEIIPGKIPFVSFQVPRSCAYTISLFDVRGRIIEFTHSWAVAGIQSQPVASKRLAGGLYTVLFRAGEFRSTHKVMMIR